jgi:hypothetical protein
MAKTAATFFVSGRKSDRQRRETEAIPIGCYNLRQAESSKFSPFESGFCLCRESAQVDACCRGQGLETHKTVRGGLPPGASVPPS